MAYIYKRKLHQHFKTCHDIKNQAQIGSLVNSNKHLRESITNSLLYIFRRWKKEILPTSFYGTVLLTSKLDKHTARKLQTTISHQHRYKSLNKIIANQKILSILKITHHKRMKFIPGTVQFQLLSHEQPHQFHKALQAFPVHRQLSELPQTHTPLIW